jgi:hypothetical protein
MNKLIIIRVHRDELMNIIEVRAQLLDVYDRMIIEVLIPKHMFKNENEIKVGRKILLSCEY